MNNEVGIMPVAAEVLEARIVVVDDLSADARLVESILLAAGYSHITVTDDLSEVLRLRRESGCDLIILDLFMPGMNRHELVGEPAAAGFGLPPILALTSNSEQVLDALDSGARDFVWKPILPRGLVARVRNLLEMRLAMKSLAARSEVLERVLAERTASLAASERLFRLFAERIPEALWIRGIDGVFRYANPQLGEVMGSPVGAGDTLENAFERMHPEDRERARAETKRLPRGGVDMEIRFTRAEGRERRAHVRTFPIADDNGVVEWVGGILEDVTERRELELGLRDAEARFRALVEQSIAGIYTIEDGAWAYVNPRMCEMLGYPEEELLGRAKADFVVEDDREILRTNRARAASGGQGEVSATYRFMRRDGGIVHLRMDSRMVQKGGRPVILGVAQDVTERVRAEGLLREAEEHYRALVEQSLVGIYIMERDRIMYANRALLDLMGFSLQELTGRRPKELVDPGDHDLVDEVVARRKAGETGSILSQFTARRKDGTRLHLEAESKIVELAGRKAALGVVRDISERARARAALEAANRRLRHLSDRVLSIQEEERRVLSIELHDDVGQSLLALQIGLHRLSQVPAQAEPKLLAECLDIVRAVQNTLRETSVRLHPPQLTQLGLPDALQALVSRQRATTGLDIRCSFDGPAKGEVTPAVEIACYRICQEALNNATRHAAARTIEVRTKREAGRLCLSVDDDGGGFDADAQREATGVSNSLGLISMEERARLAGGEFELRTAVGAGTVVIAMFPRKAAAAAAAVET